jgi:hypothetical protein
MEGLAGYQRNPWNGISDWREFRYDVEHPVLFLRRAIAGMRGRIPHVTLTSRILIAWVLFMGFACIIMAIAVEIHAHI